MKTMVRDRSQRVVFSRQIAQDYLSGETLHCLAIARSAIRAQGGDITIANRPGAA